MRYHLRLLCVYLALLIVYLAIAYTLLAPLGLYGTADRPRIQDPWVSTSQTLLRGGLLYREVYTTDPPLAHYLLVPPSFVVARLGLGNPWATLVFVLYLSLFHLFTSFVILGLPESKPEGFRLAFCFLLNPLTVGATVLLVGEASIFIYFSALALSLAARNKHGRAALALGLALLVKLLAGWMVAVAFLNTLKWRYLVLSLLVLALVLGPLIYLAGASAQLWTLNWQALQSPFRFGGISAGALWAESHPGPHDGLLRAYSVAFIGGVLLVLGVIAWKPAGLLEDLTLLAAVGVLLAPRLHGGYLGLLVLAMTPLLRRYRLEFFYFTIGTLVLLASLWRTALGNAAPAFTLMVASSVLIVAMLVWMRWPRREKAQSTPEGTPPQEPQAVPFEPARF